MENIDKLIEVLDELSNCNNDEELEMLIKMAFEDLTILEANTDEESSMIREKRKDVGARRQSGLLALDEVRKHVKDLNKEVEKLTDRGKFTEGIAFHLYGDRIIDIPQRRGNVLPVAELVGEASERVKNDIWNCLTDDNVRKIGVYGMGGAGKTSTMKYINNLLVKEEKGKFDCVIWVTVSKPFSLTRLQSDIASILEVNLTKCKDVTHRSGRLHAALEARKRYVLILDDLWEGFHLQDVGIPEPTILNGCKVILTTRVLEVCHFMSCRKIRVELLSNKEAWKLFKNCLEIEEFLTGELENIARDVAVECACLPLAIVTIASGMKHVTEASEWRDARAKLQSYSKEPDDKCKKVIEQLKFSYDRLKNKKLKECLLYCALYPEDRKIIKEELIELLIAKEIVAEKTTRQAEFDEGYVMLNKLKNSCLLEGGIMSNGIEYVKMHDLIRDMALQIISMTPSFEEKWLKDVENVSFARNDISKIRSCLSPTFQANQLKGIPNSSFQHFYELKFLNLSDTLIKDLPDEVSNLVNLVSLLLQDCHNLECIPSLARLKGLKSLNLARTEITKVPEGLEKLINLRYLNLAINSLATIPSGLIPRLYHLQHLVLWNGSPLSSGPKVNGGEVMSLKHLEIFIGEIFESHSVCAYFRQREVERSSLANYLFRV